MRIDDPLALLVLSVMRSHKDKAAQATRKPELAGWFVGQVMKEVRGHANADEVRALVESELRTGKYDSSLSVG